MRCLFFVFGCVGGEANVHDDDVVVAVCGGLWGIGMCVIHGL